jgi:hypothetical protein
MSKMQYYWMMTDGGRKRQNDIIVRPRVRVEDPYILYDGVLINNWEDDMLFEYSPKEGHIITEYLGNVYGWDIFSEKAINLLGDLITNDVQLLPIKVVNNDTGLEIDKYFVVNVLRFLDALDLENADHYYSGDGEEKELSVIKYAIKEEKAAGHHIFRLKESRFALFVSEDFYRTVQKNKIVGCYFSKVYTS